ncbi:MAG: hypothetical protein HYS35_02715 [Betaproteobacteria bacterium]|nr:hypothetical protein [Betaproteobacteria bacterium]
MSEDNQQQILETLREIREGQREIIELLSANKSVAEEQIRSSKERIGESIGLQRQALQRQRVVTLIAVPGIVLCIAAIVYLVVKYRIW